MDSACPPNVVPHIFVLQVRDESVSARESFHTIGKTLVKFTFACSERRKALRFFP
jgi:hypothetical protein